MRSGLRAALAVVALLAAATLARAGIVRQVRDNGPDDNRVVLLIIAEGYTAGEQAQFDLDAEQTVVDFLAQPPWDAYPRHVNVYTDFVISNESGADKPLPCYAVETYRDTAFGASYCRNSTQRLLTATRTLVLAEAAAVLPSVDLVAVQVNDAEYGGGGGAVLTFSVNAQRSELFLHEHGHTFAGLADEYEWPLPGVPPSDREPNVDIDSTRGLIDWDPWIEATTPLPTPPALTTVVGAVEGARYFSTGIFRPRVACKMRTLGDPFCEVCAEAIVQTISTLVSPIDSAAPLSGAAGYDPCDVAGLITLSVTPVSPRDPTLLATWTVDGVVDPLATGFSHELATGGLGGGVHQVEVTVTDTTPLVRRRFLSPMSASASWTLDPALGPDSDGDGTTDACDCAPQDGGAFAVPAGPDDLFVTKPAASTDAALAWDDVSASAGDGTGYDVASDTLSRLRAARTADGACVARGVGAPAFVDARPIQADGFYFLVRAANPCGLSPTGWGADSLGRARPACP